MTSVDSFVPNGLLDILGDADSIKNAEESNTTSTNKFVVNGLLGEDDTQEETCEFVCIFQITYISEIRIS